MIQQKLNQNLKILSLNCNSLYNKLPNIKQMVVEEAPDILCLCETWLDDKYLPKFKDYSTEWKNRDKRGGGLGLIINKNIQYKTIELPKHKDGVMEVQAIGVYMRDGSILHILNMYNH